MEGACINAPSKGQWKGWKRSLLSRFHAFHGHGISTACSEMVAVAAVCFSGRCGVSPQRGCRKTAALSLAGDRGRPPPPDFLGLTGRRGAGLCGGEIRAEVKREGKRVYSVVYALLSISGPLFLTLPTKRFAGLISISSDSNGRMRSMGGCSETSLESHRS